MVCLSCNLEVISENTIKALEEQNIHHFGSVEYIFSVPVFLLPMYINEQQRMILLYHTSLHSWSSGSIKKIVMVFKNLVFQKLLKKRF